MVISNKPEQKIRLQSLTDHNLKIDHKTVDLSKLGYFGGYLKNGIMPKSYDNLLVKSLVAFTKKEKNTDETRIGVREILPRFDLLDGDGNTFSNNEWIQRYPNDIKDKLHYGSSFSVYTADRASKNDQKIMLLYGIQYLSTYVLADTMGIWRKGTKIIDQLPLENFPKQNQVSLFRTPIIKNVNDLLDIAFTFYNINNVLEGVDRIKLLGYVTEPIGYNVM